MDLIPDFPADVRTTHMRTWVWYGGLWRAGGKDWRRRWSTSC